MEKGHWYTDENGHHYFVKEGQSPKEGWEATKRRKMIKGGKYQTSEDGKNWKDSTREEYEKYEADEMEFDKFDLDEEKQKYVPQTKVENLDDKENDIDYDFYSERIASGKYNSPEDLGRDLMVEEKLDENTAMDEAEKIWSHFMSKEFGYYDTDGELNSFLNKVKENKSNSDKVSVNGRMFPSDAQKMSANLEKELKEIFPGKIVTVGYNIKGDNTTFDYKVNGLGGKSQSDEFDEDEDQNEKNRLAYKKYDKYMDGADSSVSQILNYFKDKDKDFKNNLLGRLESDLNSYYKGFMGENQLWGGNIDETEAYYNILADELGADKTKIEELRKQTTQNLPVYWKKQQQTKETEDFENGIVNILKENIEGNNKKIEKLKKFLESNKENMKVANDFKEQIRKIEEENDYYNNIVKNPKLMYKK